MRAVLSSLLSVRIRDIRMEPWHGSTSSNASKSMGAGVMRSIPRKPSGNWDWNSLPDGRYYVEWYEQGSRRREPAGTTVAQALEVQRRRRHLAEGQALGLTPAMHVLPAPDSRRLLRPLVDRHLDQVNTLKKPNTYRKYEAVLNRFCDSFHDRSFESISDRGTERLRCSPEKEWDAIEHSSSQRRHHCPVLQAQRSKRDHASTSASRAQCAVAQGVSGG